MILSNPVQIAPNLEAGVKIGNDWITIAYSKRAGRNGRTRYQWTLLGESFPDDITDDDIQSGCQGGSLANGLQSLLSFLGAAAEAYQYAMRSTESMESYFTDPDSNASLFPRSVVEWSYAHSDEIACLSCELDETEPIKE